MSTEKNAVSPEGTAKERDNDPGLMAGMDISVLDAACGCGSGGCGGGHRCCGRHHKQSIWDAAISVR